uniref:Uncharacterized protein n=1 Tax=Brassica oleracea var. oleracea TaxID=109376 RepID=A0A0D3DE22_BRAOL
MAKTRLLEKGGKARLLLARCHGMRGCFVGYALNAKISLSLSLSLSLSAKGDFDVSSGGSRRRHLLRWLASATSPPVALFGDLSLEDEEKQSRGVHWWNNTSTKRRTSGQNEDDVLKAVHEIFFNDYKLKFSMEHAWRELRNDQK